MSDALRIFSPHGPDAQLEEGIVAMGYYPHFVSEGPVDAVFVDCDLAPLDADELGAILRSPLLFFRGEQERCGPLVERLLAMDHIVQAVHAVGGSAWGAAYKSVHIPPVRSSGC